VARSDERPPLLSSSSSLKLMLPRPLTRIPLTTEDLEEVRSMCGGGVGSERGGDAHSPWHMLMLFSPLSRYCPPQLEAIKRDRAAAAAAAQSPLQAIQATAETTPQGTAPQVGERREEKERKKRKKREARAPLGALNPARPFHSFPLSRPTHQTRLTVAQRIGLAG